MSLHNHESIPDGNFAPTQETPRVEQGTTGQERPAARPRRRHGRIAARERSRFRHHAGRYPRRRSAQSRASVAVAARAAPSCPLPTLPSSQNHRGACCRVPWCAARRAVGAGRRSISSNFPGWTLFATYATQSVVTARRPDFRLNQRATGYSVDRRRVRGDTSGCRVRRYATDPKQ